MKTTAKTTEDNYKCESLELIQGGDEWSMSADPEQYSEVYRGLAELIGDTAVRKIWKNYAGMTVTFPMQLYSRDYIRRFIADNAGKKKPSEIARIVGLSERRVRQILQELKNQGGSK